MLVMSEDEALALLSFLVTAARTQVDEPPEYAPLRLLTAAPRLGDSICDRVSPATRQLLSGPLKQIGEVQTPTSDPEGYAARLDAMCAAIAQHLLAHFGPSGGSR